MVRTIDFEALVNLTALYIDKLKELKLILEIDFKSDCTKRQHFIGFAMKNNIERGFCFFVRSEAESLGRSLYLSEEAFLNSFFRKFKPADVFICSEEYPIIKDSIIVEPIFRKYNAPFEEMGENITLRLGIYQRILENYWDKKE